MRLLAAISIVGMMAAVSSCRDSELTDETEFAVYFAGGTDIGPGQSMNLTAPTWKGQTPSDFKIYRITLDGELYETESFSIESETGIISIRNTSSLEVGLYSLSISCKSGGNYYEFPDAVTVNMMKPVPDEIKVEPAELVVSLETIRTALFDSELPTAQVTTDGDHITVTSYSIANVHYDGATIENKNYFSISSDGVISITMGNMDILPGVYTLDLKLTTAIADAESEEGIFTDALAINVTAPPMELVYSSSPARVEENYSHTSAAPQLTGSRDGLVYSIKTVSPESAASVFSVDQSTGVITLAEANGLPIGTICSVSLTVTNDYGTADFDDVYNVTIVDYIAPITEFGYEDLTIIQGQEFSHEVSVMDGDEVTYAFGESLTSELAEYLSINETSGAVSAEHGHGLPMGTYTVPVVATNIKGSMETSFSLKVDRNPYYFTYVNWGNNLGLTPAENYASQFSFGTRGTDTFPIAATDIPEDLISSIEWEVTVLSGGRPLTVDQATGAITVAARNNVNEKNPPRVDSYIITATAGKGQPGETSVKIPVFVRTLGKAVGGVTVEYSPFVFQVNPRTGGTSAPAKITGGPEDMSKFLMDYRRTFDYYNIDGPEEHVNGQPGAGTDRFMYRLWAAYADATGATSVNTGAKAPMSYYENEANLAVALGYVRPSDFAVVINPGRWVDSYGYANGIMTGQMVFSTVGDKADLSASGDQNKQQVFPIAIWFDTDFTNE